VVRVPDIRDPLPSEMPRAPLPKWMMDTVFNTGCPKPTRILIPPNLGKAWISSPIQIHGFSASMAVAATRSARPDWFASVAGNTKCICVSSVVTDYYKGG
jgi:hypothetical protein